MFTTGSKLFIGGTVLALTGTLVYGIGQNGSALGTIGMVTVTIIFAFLMGINFWVRDSNVSSMDTAGIETCSAASKPAGRSIWPLVGGFGLALLPVGLVVGGDPDDGHAQGGHLVEHRVDGPGSHRDGRHPTAPCLGGPEGVLEGGGVGGGEPHAQPVPGDRAVEWIDGRAEVADTEAGDDQRPSGEGVGSPGSCHPWWKTTPCPPSG